MKKQKTDYYQKMRFEYRTLKALQNIYDYLEKDERKSFNEYLDENDLNPTEASAKRHIYSDVTILGSFIDEYIGSEMCNDDYDSRIIDLKGSG